MQTLWKFPIWLGLVLVCHETSAIVVTLELHQELTPYNLRSQRGVPISNTHDVPPGSDGRMPMSNESFGSTSLPLTNQHLFRGFISFGATPGLTSSNWYTVSNTATLKYGTNAFSGSVAELMKLPLGKQPDNDQVVVVLRRAQVGAPYLSRQVSFSFGSVVAVPRTDERGILLTNVPPESYWLAQPYVAANETNTDYYWSPNARQVFANQSGPIMITWRKADAYTANTVPAYTNGYGAPSFQTNDNLHVYLLYTVRYVVSSSPVKTPRKMYWTEKEFNSLGKLISVPTARVGSLAIIYNNNFPETVSVETNNPPAPVESRTMWYDKGGDELIHAYNAEGRVFVELLGDNQPDGSRKHLGFEIVDVFKQPDPIDQTIELGERLTPPPPGSLDELFPESINEDFAYQHNVTGTDEIELYATDETANLNDCLVHWMEEGLEGIRWPRHLARYALVWPDDIARYSLYVRPLVETEAEAQFTAVPLPTDNVPSIEYQDPLDQPRAQFTSDFKFYTWLDQKYPAHRTLLNFSVGDNVAFERVYSFLDSSLKAPSNFVGSVAESLTAWDPTNKVFHWPNDLTSPRVEYLTATVGERITAPPGEPGASGTYLAGHINETMGTSFDSTAYIDPFSSGADAANLGAIIPVNAIPGTNVLEVWWFRPNGASAGPNVANKQQGFKTTYWPSVIAQYTNQWPQSLPAHREIVLASKLGSGTLDTFQAEGQIYFQNVPGQRGYNPNEEHALMSGGIAYATRDDLNITNADGYSSHPFVLVRYVAQDGRPAITVFKVLREKPEAGYVFDYISPAGQMLQAPMPLPLLQKPVEGSGDTAKNYNTEPSHTGGDLPGRWTDQSTNGPFAHYQYFTYSDRHHDSWVYRGLHAGLPVLESGKYDTNTSSFVPLPNATAVVGQPFSFFLHASRQSEYLGLTVPAGLPNWLHIDHLSLQGTPAAADVKTTTLQLVIEDFYDHTRVTNNLVLAVVASGAVATQGPLVICCSNQYTGTITWYSNRPAFVATSPTSSNSFTMRFYYKTQPGFAFPGVTAPADGAIVPYLRPYNNTTHSFAGDSTSKTSASLEIVYRPVWPERDPKDSGQPLPTLPYGASLAKPGFGLPGVRDMKTAFILYQQSIAANITNGVNSAVLHDPTRQKYADLEEYDMEQLPSSVQTDFYQGRYYFPSLPPHLANRLFFDSNRGPKGSLVLQGEFKDEVVGESYLLLNVMRGSDLAAALALCSDSDPAKTHWDDAITNLTAEVETFFENLAQPGTYIPNQSLTVPVGVQDLAEVKNDNSAVDSYALSATGPGSGYVTLLESSGTAFTQPGDPVSMHIFRVVNELHPGEVKVLAADNPLSELVTFQHTPDLAGRFDEYKYEWKIAAPVDGMPPVTNTNMSNYLPLASGTNIPRYTLGGAGIQALCDNYVTMHYSVADTNHPLYGQWSPWTTPKLAEGWIKRVLAGINPFIQRTSDLFNNRVSTDVSMLTQAGHRWEGDVALNADTLNNYGLIEIYETVLRRARMLSIESGYNYGPANDALLLSAGYLNDLYMMEGNEGWADAANPTIGIGTKDNTYGDIATALFAFKGQVPSLLEENLALLRGRDDFLQPGVQTQPVYNRLVWNYTEGIDSGQAIYALNYDIQENPDKDPDGVIDATDAAYLYPQGHGDAYGHYLTALKGYYSLLLNAYFDWVPRIEAVDVLGMTVSVDYQDERKFAAAAATLARAGQQVFDLTWRKDYQPVSTVGWQHFGATRVNTQRKVPTTRYWSLDHWACRTGQGAYLNWVVGNALLPAVDPNPDHEAIQKVDRTTVPELQELTTLAQSLQSDMDSAEGGLSPLGLPEGGLAFDLNPAVLSGTDNGTHFEQIYERAKVALNNAVAAFDDAKDVTRLMRSEQDSLTDFQAGVAREETAFNNSLIELYGTPYPDDMGPGKTYKQEYTGPDIIHYMYVELPEEEFPALWNYPTQEVFRVDIQDLPADWVTNHRKDMNFYLTGEDSEYTNQTPYLEFNVGTHGFYDKPSQWTGKRTSPGKIQQDISKYIAAHEALRQAMWDSDGGKVDVDKAIEMFKAEVKTHDNVKDIKRGLLIAQQVLDSAQFATEMYVKALEDRHKIKSQMSDAFAEALPQMYIAGMAMGGDMTSFARAYYKEALAVETTFSQKLQMAAIYTTKILEFLTKTTKEWTEFEAIQPMEWDEELKKKVAELGDKLSKLQGNLWVINERLRAMEDAQRNYSALVAQGDRIQAQRETFRKRAAAVVQGYRTRDAAFRFFRDEKLERYKTLFDLAARYSLLAANAYDYETGLLNTSAGRSFINRIVNAQALGIVRDGQPQYAGSDTGDPGLSSALAEMKADWDVLRGRLGFNNPDAYGTTVSLRTECLRILPGTDGDANWVDTLNLARRDNVLDDEDVRRYCMQLDTGNGLAVPGIVLTFSTTITDGHNLFGQPLAAGDHAFNPSSFATKIFAAGVALEGYRGMDDPTATSGTGGTSPPDPGSWYLDPLALSATPYIYLIPVGVDSMRSPPLGDTSTVRTWMVEDVAIPMPFNIGASDFSTKQLWQSSDSLTEPLFAMRKHQAFRPVSTASLFSRDLYGPTGTLLRSQYTNNRLVGRSVWNSQWKVVIPGTTLLYDPNEGLDRFLQTVKDLKLHFVTYSYSGN